MMDFLNGHRVVSEDIIKTMLYFDIFQYPLTVEEISRFSKLNCTPVEIQAALDAMIRQGILFRHQQYYSMHESATTIERRKKGNAEAQRKMRVARWMAGLISRFPFVRAVLLSGSISKGYMDASSDIDFFVITKPGKVWTTRLLLALFKRLFLFNSKKYFCPNYLIDSDHLQIEERNLFTATELATLIPLHGFHYYHQLLKQNGWIGNYFSQIESRYGNHKESARFVLFKPVIEKLLSNGLGQWVETTAHRLILQRWEKLYRHRLPADDFAIAFKSRSYVSKSHPEFYQRQVLEKLACRISEFENRFALSL
jgi:predicted nucleotidyltransferase